MSPFSDDCGIVRDELAELALGIAVGEQRAHALEHVAQCADCRRELEQLSSLADDLVALVPLRDPPAGFESRVLGRIAPRRTRLRPTRRRVQLAFAAALPAVAAVTALVVTGVYSSDLRLASQYRATLRNAHGSYFQSARLDASKGRAAGVVFAYQGSPSWLFYTLNRRYQHGLYVEQIRTRSGTTLTLPPFKLDNGSWGVATPVAVRDIAHVKLVRRADGAVLTATLPVVER